jgi:hypothetical protein
MKSGSIALFGFGILPLTLGALGLFGTPLAPSVTTITVTAQDYTLEAPDTVAAGPVAIKLLNQGKEFHHVWIARLEGGRTLADVEQALRHPGHPPAWLHDVGGPNAPMPQGGEANATVVLREGTYVLGCWIPSPDGVPHIMKGMVRKLTVVPAKRFAPAPSPTVTMTLHDYGFRLSQPLTPGRHVIEVRNLAEQSHEIELVTLADGKSAQDLLAWTHKPEGAAPGAAIGGVSPIAKGEVAWFEVDLAPGRYAFLCFLPDATDGKPHFAHGMVQELELGAERAAS